jgi:hypothetical protein
MEKLKCPHCHTELTAKEAIMILHGTGSERMVPVRFANGKVGFMEAGQVNPTAVEVLESF